MNDFEDARQFLDRAVEGRAFGALRALLALVVNGLEEVGALETIGRDPGVCVCVSERENERGKGDKRGVRREERGEDKTSIAQCRSG